MGVTLTLMLISLFGIEERPLDDATNDINASSQFGLSGTVAIDTSNISRDRDLVRLPEQPTEREIVRTCDRNQDSKENEFVVKGSGGLPPSLEDPLNSDAIEVDWIERQAQSSSQRFPIQLPKNLRRSSKLKDGSLTLKMK